MNKNVKRIFLAITLLFLLVGLTAISATDVSEDRVVLEDTGNTIAPEVATTTASSDDIVADTPAKNIEKEEKNIKTSTKTVEVNNWNELKTTMNTATQDTENDTYIINLNDGTYKMPFTVNFNGISNITINGNGQTLESKSFTEMYTYGGILTFNDLTIKNTNIHNNVNLTLNNIVLYGGFENSKNVELNNVTIENGVIWNYEDCNLIIKNSTIDVDVYNEDGTIIIGDDVVFGEYFTIGGGEIIINDTNRLTPYLSEFNGDYIIENTEINRYITNSGNLTLRNVTVNMIVGNSGNLILENCTMNAGINNEDGSITITDDVIFGEDFYIARDVGEIITNHTDILLLFSELYGDYIIENQVISHLNQVHGNLTIRNSTFNYNYDTYLINNGNLTIEDLTLNQAITNKGNLTIKNTTLNSNIYQNSYDSILTIADDVIIGEGFSITHPMNRPRGTIIINDYSRIFKYVDAFNYEATVELGDYNKTIDNYGNLTIENTTFSATMTPVSSAILTNRENARLIIRNSTTNTQNAFSNRGTMEIYNSTIDLWIANSGVLIISDDTNIGENFKITGNGEVLTNNTQLLDYVKLFQGNVELTNQSINTPKTNKGTLNLTNCTVNTTITNDGTIIIDEDTVFTENAKITGTGKIIINDITRILPIIDSINGNYIINDTTLTKNYAFDGEVTLNNCTLNTPDNINFGTLTLNNCNIDVDEEETFLTNYGTLNISDDTTITGKVVDLVGDGAYIITQDTIGYFFDQTGLTQIVKPGDTLDVQGTIRLNQSLIVNKPVNIISTTKDAYIDLDTHAGSMFGDSPGNCFVINNEGSYTNVTGIYFHNTQLWIYNTHHVTLDNISAVVENQAIGSGVGQTSIRANSTYITLKNSFIYTKNNGGSSSVVLAWADNCIIENNTIQGVGFVGNLLYLTTYNVDIPEGIVPNCNNQILGNVIIGPEESSAICVAIMLSGANNTIGNNQVYYVGAGIDGQWTGEGYSDTQNNTFYNNSQKRKQPQNELIIDTTEFTAGENATITAKIMYTNKVLTDINKGKVTFKVNGKTLKDASGKVIYAKVVNGTATIENYTVPDDWAKEGTTIQAVYSGSTQCEKLTSEKTNITVEKAAPTLTTETVTGSAGSTVQLKATITDGDKVINSGKVVFKINGKTVKDTNGKVIYAKVLNNQVIVNYTLPADMKAKDYNITVTFISSDYERLEDTKVLSVTA